MSLVGSLGWSVLTVFFLFFVVDIFVYSLQIPEIFNMLQTCVQAVLLGGMVADMDWSSKGILGKSCVEEWPLEGWSPQEKGVASGMASDGLYLYLHGSHGLVKVGSGYGNTKKV